MTPSARVLALPAQVFPPLFVPTAAALSVVNRKALQPLSFAGLLAAAAAAGRTPGWYVFVSGFFGWVSLLARRVARGAPTGR